MRAGCSAPAPPQSFTAEMAGRSFLGRRGASDSGGCRRAWRQAPGVIDAIIQGSRVRVVTAQPAPRGPDRAGRRRADLELVPTPPRFEDSFVARLRTRQQRTARRAPPRRHPRRCRRRRAGARRCGAGGDRDRRCGHLTRRFGAFVAVDDVTLHGRAAARSSACSAPTAPASPPPSGCCAACCRHRPARLRVAGFDLRTAAAPARGRIGYMAQKFSLYADLSVLQNLRFFSSAYRLAGARQRARIDWALAEFGLGRCSRPRPAICRSGFKQRLALACALMHEPEILFLDEPTSGVDPLARREFWRRINALAGVGRHRAGDHPFHGGGRVLRPTADPGAGPGPRRGRRRRPSRRAARRADRPSRPWRTPSSPCIEAAGAAERPHESPVAAPRAGTAAQGSSADRARSFGARDRLPPAGDPAADLRLRRLARRRATCRWRWSSSSPDALTAKLHGRVRAARRYFHAAALHHDSARPSRRWRAHDVERHRLAARRLHAVWLRRSGAAPIGVIVNGVDANNARLVEGYVQQVWAGWLAARARAAGRPAGAAARGPAAVRFNPAVSSRDYLVPGLIAMIMTLTGALADRAGDRPRMGARHAWRR